MNALDSLQNNGSTKELNNINLIACIPDMQMQDIKHFCIDDYEFPTKKLQNIDLKIHTHGFMHRKKTSNKNRFFKSKRKSNP